MHIGVIQRIAGTDGTPHRAAIEIEKVVVRTANFQILAHDRAAAVLRDVSFVGGEGEQARMLAGTHAVEITGGWVVGKAFDIEFLDLERADIDKAVAVAILVDRDRRGIDAQRIEQGRIDARL